MTCGCCGKPKWENRMYVLEVLEDEIHLWKNNSWPAMVEMKPLTMGHQLIDHISINVYQELESIRSIVS